jgi:alpha-tubulin suppressor-like RCC1 family protein
MKQKNSIPSLVFMLLILLQSLTVSAQLSRASNKGSNPYRNTYQRMSSGSSAPYTLEIRNGTLWAWGFNGDGELGDGTTIQRNSPVQIGTGNTWTNISTGNGHTLGLKSDGTLWAW